MTAPLTPRFLPDALGTEADEQLCQLRGLVDLMQAGAKHVDRDDTIPAVCWVIDEKLTRLQEIVDARQPAQLPTDATP